MNRLRQENDLFSNEHYLKYLPRRDTIITDAMDPIEVLSFPTRLNKKDKHPLLKTDGLNVQFNAVTANDAHNISSSADSATTSSGYNLLLTPTSPLAGETEEHAVKGYVIRADDFIQPSCGVFYFECTVLNAGDRDAQQQQQQQQETDNEDEMSSNCLSNNSNNNAIFIGLITANVPLHYLPGTTTDRYSYSYCSQNGRIYNNAMTQGENYATRFTTGDTVGCCINFITQTIHFTKNGVHLGVAFKKIQRINYYPCIALSNSKQSVRINFGSQPFKYNLQQSIGEGKDLIKSWIEETALEIHDQTKSPGNKQETDLDAILRHLVLSYLVYHGYAKTAAIFAKDSNAIFHQSDAQISKHEFQQTVVEQIQRRQHIIQLVHRGDIDSVLKNLNLWYPSILSDRFDILFELKCHKFLEILNSESLQNAVIYGQQELVTLVDNNLTQNSPITGIISHQREYSSRVALSSPSSMVTSSDEEEEFDSEDENLEDIQMGKDFQSTREWQQKQILHYEKCKERLEDLFSLLAYVDRSKSPMAHLMQIKEQRNLLAQKLNEAILSYESDFSQNPLSNFKVPAIERIIAQSENCLSILEEMQSRQCGYSFISYKDFL